jgi:serine phosphatase RsbU (regulator of sigma subunit)
MNPQGEELGLQRLCRLVEAGAASAVGAEDVVAGILAALTAWTGSRAFDDDVALVAIRRVSGRP